MKKLTLTIFMMLLIGSFLLITNAVVTAAEGKGKMETATGKVTAVDPEGKGITLSAKVGKETMDIGTIVNEETIVKVKGKKASLDDIKVGDVVIIRYVRTDNLYAKEIIRK